MRGIVTISDRHLPCWESFSRMQWKMVALATFGAVARVRASVRRGRVGADHDEPRRPHPAAPKARPGTRPSRRLPRTHPRRPTCADLSARADHDLHARVEDTALRRQRRGARRQRRVVRRDGGSGGQAGGSARLEHADGRLLRGRDVAEPAGRAHAARGQAVDDRGDGPSTCFTIENGWGMAEAEGADACTGQRRLHEHLPK